MHHRGGRDKEVKAVATLNSFINGERWMRDGMGNDAFGKSVARLRQDRIKRITTNDPVLMHPYTDYPNITESGDFYTDHVLKEINGGIQSSVDADSGEEFPTPMSTAIGEELHPLQCGGPSAQDRAPGRLCGPRLLQ